MFTKAFHWSVSYSRWIQSITIHSVSLRSILIIFSRVCLGLPSCLSPCSFPTIIQYTSLCAIKHVEASIDGCKINIVAYRSVAKQWLYERLPLLCNTRNIHARHNRRTTVFMQRRGNHASTTIQLLLETAFSTRSVQSSYLEDNWGDPVSCQFSVESWVLHGRLKDTTWSREAEESPLLEAVARERLSWCCGDLRIVEINDSVVNACSSESCV
jgi:hypothetical protein